jgi:hypothetical protein
MKLHERLPDSVTAGGKTYRVDLDFRNVLRMIDVLGREEMLPSAREYVALKCVMKRPPKNAGPVLAALRDVLFSADSEPAEQKLTDFEQDADLIRAAFLQAFGINLWRDRVHWLEFTGLLGALPEGSRYADILGIRARPMPKPTKYNAEERAWLAKAKLKHAVRMTEREAQNKYSTDLQRIATAMIGLAKKGGGE